MLFMLADACWTRSLTSKNQEDRCKQAPRRVSKTGSRPSRAGSSERWRSMAVESNLTRRHSERSDTWEYQKSGAFHCFLGEVCGIPKGENIARSASAALETPDHFFHDDSQTRMRVLHVVAETPASFLQHLKELTFIEKKPLRWVSAVFALPVKMSLCLLILPSCRKILCRKTFLACPNAGNEKTRRAFFIAESGLLCYISRDLRQRWFVFYHMTTVLILRWIIWLLGFLLILEPFESDMATVPNPIFHLT